MSDWKQGWMVMVMMVVSDYRWLVVVLLSRGSGHNRWEMREIVERARHPARARLTRARAVLVARLRLFLFFARFRLVHRLG